jgi:hypothetical protein
MRRRKGEDGLSLGETEKYPPAPLCDYTCVPISSNRGDGDGGGI